MKKSVIIAVIVVLAIIIFSFVALNGDDEITQQDSTTILTLSSPAFQNNQPIPQKYTCDGEDISPPLTIENVPEGTQSLVLIMDDPDAPSGTWVHWIVFNIDPETTSIAEDSVPRDALQSSNSWRLTGYGGPCPPSGTHRYMFKLYALDFKIRVTKGNQVIDVEQEIQGHIIEQTTLIGTYSK